jgi:WD40 repeat protein
MLRPPMRQDEADVTLTSLTSGVPSHAPPGPEVSTPGVRPPERYQVIAEHGRGGLGRVLRAHDLELQRDVAIKEIILRSDAAEARFLREAIVTARLEHPGIVPVHDAGHWPDGTPFYAMKLVSGRPLKEVIRKATSLAERLALLPHVIAVADAMAYAHDRGIVHRDLKPSNIIVGDFGETIVIDWGLAKDTRSPVVVGADEAERVSERSGDADLTRTGAVLGTPAYMPPEQARGEDVDEKADVYALGAVLYHVMGGSPPYGGSKDEVLSRVLTTLPEPLESIAPRVPAELVAIIRKAMARDPRDRYPAAGMLAEDLRRFHTGQLVGAHDYSRAALLSRWVRRHRVSVTVAVVATLALIVGGAISIQGILASRGEARAQRAVAIAQRLEADAERRSAVARANNLVLSQARDSLERDPTMSIAWLKSYPEDGKEITQAYRIAADALSRGVARRVLVGRRARVGAVVALDGGFIASIAGGDSLRIWDPESPAPVLMLPAGSELRRNELKRLMAASADRRRLVFRSEAEGLLVIDGPDWKPRALGACGPDSHLFALSPSGRRVVCLLASGTISVVDVNSGTATALVGTASNRPASSLGFLDENAIVTGQQDGQVVVRSLMGRAGQVLPRPTARSGVAWTQSGPHGLVVIRYFDGRLRLWNTVSGASRPLGGADWVDDIAISPTGSLALARGSGVIEVVGPDGLEATALPGLVKVPWSLSFSSDGRLLGAGGEDGDLAVWDLDSGERREFNGHRLPVSDLSFAPDGQSIVSGSSDRTVRVWPMATTPHRVVRTGKYFLMGLATDAHGKLVASAGQDGVARIVEVESLLLRSIVTSGSLLVAVALSRDGAMLATGSLEGLVEIWDASTGRKLGQFDHGNMALDLDFSPDGRWLASGGYGGQVKLYDVHGGSARALASSGADVFDVEFSPGGDRFATASFDGSVTLWSVSAGPPQLLGRHAGAATSLAFSATGDHLVTGSWDGTARLWDVETGHFVSLNGLADRIAAVAISRDGRRIAAGSEGGEIRLWSATGEALETLAGHTQRIASLQFSADGQWLVSSSFDQTGRLWSLTSGSVSVLRGHEAELSGALFVSEGQAIVTAGRDGAFRYWPLGTLPQAPAGERGLHKWLDSLTTALPPE